MSEPGDFLIHLIIGIICVVWGSNIIKEEWKENHKFTAIIVGGPLVLFGLFCVTHADAVPK